MSTSSLVICSADGLEGMRKELAQHLSVWTVRLTNTSAERLQQPPLEGHTVITVLALVTNCKHSNMDWQQAVILTLISVAVWW